MKNETILVLDFGGQYNQLIARRVRECNVYAEVHPHTMPVAEIKAMAPKGIIFTGGPNSVFGESALSFDKELFELGVPILGICYGAQLMAHALGGVVQTAETSEYGKTELIVEKEIAIRNGYPDGEEQSSRGENPLTKEQSDAIGRSAGGEKPSTAETADNAGSVTKGRLYQEVPKCSTVWMSHTDRIVEPPAGFTVTGKTKDCPVASMENTAKGFYAVQFHPEVMHSQYGKRILRAFVLDVCGCKGDWEMAGFVERSIKEIREKVGDGKVLCALSGGVDSSVAAVLMSKAVGKQLTCVFVDQGLLRKDEGDQVEAVFGPDGPYDLNFVRANVQQRFYDKLAGAEEPEQKRQIIGEEFIRVFEEEAKKIGKVDYLVQGTIYPDVIESGLGDSAVIKSHHNVGGLPDHVDFQEIIEPLRMLFKDEVRKAGLELGIPENLVYRQPFPGPGLAIRIIGEVTEEKVKIVQEADAIYRAEVEAYQDGRFAKELGQYFAALTNMRSVGVMGDFRTYDYAVALRAVMTSDFMTAEAAPIPWELLSKVTTRIVNEVKGISRVFYDCTTKPPATIEFE